jgi:kynurenine formamidase
VSPRVILRFAGVALAITLLPHESALSQSWRPAPPDKRCPSPWGATDERGAANRMDAHTVLRGLRLVKEGKVYELGRVLEAAMPTLGARRFTLQTARSGHPSGANGSSFNEELVVAELGQMGTQFDALPHVAIDNMLYNCMKIDDVATRAGFSKLGVEKVGGIVTRGVLLDIAAVKAVAMLEAGYEITVADLQEALRREGVTIGAGDAVLVHTGWGALWMKDNARFNRGEPGIDVAAAEWLAKANPILVGSDNWAIEVLPQPDRDLRSPVHQILVAINGIFLIENLDLEALVRDKVWEFAFIVTPLKIKGGSGSTVAPIAIR